MSIVNKNPGRSVSGTRKLYRDRIITSGSKYLFDFEDPYCNPHTRSAALSEGATFRNMVDGAAVGTVFGASVQNNAAGQGVSLPGINDHGVDFGTSYPMGTGPRTFLCIIWLMRRTGDATSAFAHIWGRNTNGADGEFFLYSGADGVSPVAGLYLGAGQQVNVGGSFTLDAPRQIAFAWTGSAVYGFSNGAQTFNLANAGSLDTTTGSEGIGRKTTATAFGFNTQWDGTYFRIYKEDLTTFSGTESARAAHALAQVQQDYADNIGRFS
jgi:hypothetical protein